MKADEIRRMLDDKVVVPLWPETGQVLDLTRGQTYRGAATGDIHTIRIGRLMRVPTSWLRQQLGLDSDRAVSA